MERLEVHVQRVGIVTGADMRGETRLHAGDARATAMLTAVVTTRVAPQGPVAFLPHRVVLVGEEAA